MNDSKFCFLLLRPIADAEVMRLIAGANSSASVSAEVRFGTPIDERGVFAGYDNNGSTHMLPGITQMAIAAIFSKLKLP
jgi:hypothetical protein